MAIQSNSPLYEAVGKKSPSKEATAVNVDYCAMSTPTMNTENSYCVNELPQNGEVKNVKRCNKNIVRWLAIICAYYSTGDCNYLHTVFPRSDAAATINFPLLALAATIRGRRLLEGGVNYTLHDSLLFSSINFDYVMFKSTIFGSDYC